MTTSSTVTSADGTTISFDRRGSGPALILVGGAFQHRAIDDRTTAMATALAERFTVFEYDRRGRGGSSDTQPYAVAREVEDIAALIEEAGGSAMLYGMSSGAGLSLEAVASGLSVTKLAVYEPPFVVEGEREPLPNHGPRYADLCTEGRRGDAVELFLVEAVGVPRAAVERMRQGPEWAGLESVAPTLAYDAAIMGTGELPLERLKLVTIPTLAIDGGASPDWARAAVSALVEALPDARQLTIAGQTHAIDPMLLVPILTEFYAS